MPAQMSFVFKKQKWLHFQTWGSKVSSCNLGSRLSAAPGTDSDVGTWQGTLVPAPRLFRTALVSFSDSPFSHHVKSILRNCSTRSLRFGRREKREEKKQELANFFLTLIRRKVQVVSVYTNRNNKTRNWRGNGFALSAHYLMLIDKEMLRK